MLIRRRGLEVDRGGLERRLRIEWRSTVLALLLLTFLLGYFGDYVGLQRLNHLIYGRAMALATHEPAQDVVIVALDDASIQELGYWPWRRSVHASLLERLSSARAVGLDLVLSDPNPAYPEDDGILARAINEHGRVALPLVLDNGRVDKPLSILADAAAALGYINVQPDPDGVVRSLQMQKMVNGRRVPHFVLAMQAAAGLTTQAGLLPDQTQGRENLISYAGDSGSYRMYSYARVLDGSVPASAFENKYVLIGAWAAALGDRYSVPVSRKGDPMAGVEILANGLQNVLGDHWIQSPTPLQTALLGLVPVLLVCLALRRLSPRHSFFVVLGIVALIFVLNWLLMRYFDIWLGPAATLIGIVLAYPVWNWRSQEATLRHVDTEIDQLYDQNLMHGYAMPESSGLARGGSLPARMIKLHQAIGLLRQAMGQRDEALRFLSHDMRSPQNAILALTQLQRYSKTPLSQPELLDRVDKSAMRTLSLVDGFVRLARAESVVLDLREINLADLMQTVCDERWPMARRRSIALAVETAADQAYILADGDMLSRAIGNLVDNAIHYSPDGTHVLCRLYAQGDDWVVAIQDQGRGMTQEQRAALFEPFRRFDVEAPGNPEGSGLGLAFVHTVVLRHGGRIEVDSEPGRGSSFRLIFRSC